MTPGSTSSPTRQGARPAGLNVAIRASSGDVIVRCDGHAILPPGYIGTAVETLLETGSGKRRGDTGSHREGDAAASNRHRHVHPDGCGRRPVPLRRRAGADRHRLPGHLPGAVLEKVGLYDESLIRNQDYELNWRLQEAGEEVWFEPRLRVRLHP